MDSTEISLRPDKTVYQLSEDFGIYVLRTGRVVLIDTNESGRAAEDITACGIAQFLLCVNGIKPALTKGNKS